MTHQLQDHLELLAQRLAVNHLNLSVVGAPSSAQAAHAGAPPSDDRFRAAAAIAFNDASIWTERSRTVVVVGAGASIDAFGKELLPGATDALDRIRTSLIDSEFGAQARPSLLRQISERVSRYPAMYGFTKANADFEINLSVLSEIFGQAKVRAALEKLYGRPPAHHITFEILAHLLKHRFVDAIINFNFDELLDHAVRHEMGGTQYLDVYSDGHCRRIEEIVVDGRLKRPLYVKPHGTISHPSSLRFTKEHYHELPAAMHAFLDDILTGRRVHPRPGEEDTVLNYTDSVTLISVGFGMKSLDLQRIIDQPRMHDRLRLFHLNTHDIDDGDRLRCKCRHFIQVMPVSRSLGSTMETLWDRVSAQFKRNLRPRGIKRHLLVHTLFYRPGDRHAPGRRVPRMASVDPQSDRDPTSERTAAKAEIEFAFARLCTELAIETARGNGQVSLDDLEGGRVGYFAGHLAEILRKYEAGSLPSNLDEWYRTPLAAAAHLLGLVPLRYSERMLVMADEPSEAERRRASTVDAAIARTLWRNLSAALGKISPREIGRHLEELRHTTHSSREALPPDGRGMRELSFDALIEDYLRSLCSSDTITIEPKFGAGHLLLSRRPLEDRVLHTNLAVGLQFIELVRGPWDILLLVSSFGKVLDKYAEHVGAGAVSDESTPRRYFSVVTSQALNRQAVEERMREHRERLLGIEATRGHPQWFFRPFWASRRNFAVALSLRGNTLAPLRAIEFLGSRTRANPVYTEDRDDLHRLVRTFFGYVREAVSYMPEARDLRESTGSPLKGAGRVPTVTVNDAEELKNRTLAQWAARLVRERDGAELVPPRKRGSRRKRG